MDVTLERVPIHLSVRDVITDVYRAQVADVVRQKGLLAAGICRFVLTDVGNRIVAIGFVDEEASRLAGPPGALDHPVPYHPRIELTGNFAGARIDEIVARSVLHRGHEFVGDGDGDVEVRHLRQIFLAGDEIHDIRVIDAKNAHVGAATRAALLHGIGRRVVELHERHRTGCNAGGRANHRALAAQLREPEAGSAARLMDQRHRTQRVVDAVAPVR